MGFIGSIKKLLQFVMKCILQIYMCIIQLEAKQDKFSPALCTISARFVSTVTEPNNIKTCNNNTYRLYIFVV